MVDEPEVFTSSGTGRRLLARTRERIDADEAVVTWTRAWVSRDGRWNWLLAARYRDFVVVTDRRLVLFSCGFFSRRPRRAVFDERLPRVLVEDVGTPAGRHLRVTVAAGRPLRFDLASKDAGVASLLCAPAGSEEDQSCPS
jgi:hypothetical protein